MDSPLLKIIKNQIIARGGMLDMAAFMELCLAHPEYGYYNAKDPFGKEGDFVTAPEISQLFGEMIGIFFRQIYIQKNSPPLIHLVEIGAGRGTMMRDMLRVLKPHINIQIHIVEIAENLKKIQKETLQGEVIEWHNSIETLPSDAPLFIVGNELLDALPTRQAKAVNGEWREHGVGIIDDKLNFITGSVLKAKEMLKPIEGKIFEFSPQREALHKILCEKILRQTGVLLWIDYGFNEGANTASVQGMLNHAYTPILENVGQADISSLVDFYALERVTPKGLNVGGVISQGEFLKGCGIELRKKMLIDKNPEMADVIEAGYARLTEDSQMGQLFKVLAVVK